MDRSQSQDASGMEMTAEQRRICELIYVLRHCVIFSRNDQWVAAIRELVNIGRPAVCALTAELDRTSRNSAMGALAFALSAIGDPRAVEALIRALPRTAVKSSDCGLSVIDEELAAFMRKHQPPSPPAPSAKPCRGSMIEFFARLLRPKPKHCCGVLRSLKEDGPCDFHFNRAVRIINRALEKITGHSEECDFIWASPGVTRDDEEVQRLRLQAAQRWQNWWDVHKGQFDIAAEPAAYTVSQQRDLVEIAGTDKFGPMFPTGKAVRAGAVREIELVRDEAKKKYVDLDSGRQFAAFEGATEQCQGSIFAWYRQMGIDVEPIGYVIEGRTVTWPNAVGCDMHIWPVENARWESFDRELKEDGPLQLPPWGPQYDFYCCDLQTGKFKLQQWPATFLFTTKGGSKGILRVCDVTMDPQAAKIQYRIIEA